MKITSPARLRQASLAVLCLWSLLSCSPQPEDAGESSPAAETDHSARHGSHTPRHGGQFFMSEDLEHHLEGSLVRPGELRVYLYDARTQPLPSEALPEAAATVQHADLADAPLLPARVTRTYLAFELGEVSFPCTFNLLIRFPDWSEKAPPELFTFVFDDFSEED